MTRHLTTTPLLRLALLGDAAASAGTGLLLALGAAPLAPLLGLPQGLLLAAGLLLLPYAAWVAVVGRGPAAPRNAVAAIIAINAIWVADSLLLLALSPRIGLAPTGLGVALVVFQAAVVAGFALLQWVAMRRTATGLAAA